MSLSEQHAHSCWMNAWPNSLRVKALNHCHCCSSMQSTHCRIAFLRCCYSSWYCTRSRQAANWDSPDSRGCKCDSGQAHVTIAWSKSSTKATGVIFMRVRMKKVYQLAPSGSGALVNSMPVLPSWPGNFYFGQGKLDAVFGVKQRGTCWPWEVRFGIIVWGMKMKWRCGRQALESDFISL